MKKEFKGKDELELLSGVPGEAIFIRYAGRIYLVVGDWVLVGVTMQDNRSLKKEDIKRIILERFYRD